MGFRLHKRFKLGPVYINTHNGRITSWGIKFWRISRNMTHRSTTIDTPGPGHYTHHDKRR
ncbi:DUF4236 domain-containing protein [Saccharopolyspora cebuensis]|uniref:DUF4236 domain-containing protein n=1 Tax=Saccharopolyspora cebuensis TaxID=418759 RepID=A0ABV4CME7_9PSEU